MEEKFQQLKERLGRVADLSFAAAVLNWDQETQMPPGGATARADQLATLQAVAHQFFTDEAVGRLLEDLRPWAESLPYDSDEASIVRINHRDYLKRVRIPTELVGELARASALGKKAWQEARAADDFEHFRPHLERLVALRIQWAECFSGYANRYDPLLDWFEPGMTTAYIRTVFDGLKPELVDLVAAIAPRQEMMDGSVLNRELSAGAQIAFSREVTEKLGYDYQRGRLDLSAHPFTIRFSSRDVRITTRLMADNPLKALMSSIHEAGHAMHGQAISPTLYRTGLDHGTMMAISESQSRFYENIVGRSLPFWRWLYPRFQQAFAPHFDDVTVEAFTRALNRVEPGAIRVEADEVTYGLHIMLRFELEQALINETLQVADLPREWNDRMEAYLGVRPASDAEGVMQDIHWSQGAIGYFPDYLLGSLLAVQLWERLRRDLPDVEEQIARGEFGAVLGWQREHVMQHGRKFTLPELTERVTGGPLRWEPYMAYLRQKVGAIYGLG